MIQKFIQDGVIKPPASMGEIGYVVRSGSVSYGVSDDDSDNDIVVVSLPNLREEFFQQAINNTNFRSFQAHHIQHEGKEYDFTIYNLNAFVSMCINTNPNIIDCLFAEDEDVLYIHPAFKPIRAARKAFLSKLCYHRYGGYSFSQFEKSKNKSPQPSRQHLVDKYGYDTKFMYHTYRLMSQAKQVLRTHNLSLKNESRIYIMRQIREGYYSFKVMENQFIYDQVLLKKIYEQSDLRHSPDKKQIREALEETLGILEEQPVGV